jgi:hypothetical protein
MKTLETARIYVGKRPIGPYRLALDSGPPSLATRGRLLGLVPVADDAARPLLDAFADGRSWSAGTVVLPIVDDPRFPPALPLAAVLATLPTTLTAFVPPTTAKIADEAPLPLRRILAVLLAVAQASPAHVLVAGPLDDLPRPLRHALAGLFAGAVARGATVLVIDPSITALDALGAAIAIVDDRGVIAPEIVAPWRKACEDAGVSPLSAPLLLRAAVQAVVPTTPQPAEPAEETGEKPLEAPTEAPLETPAVEAPLTEEPVAPVAAVEPVPTVSPRLGAAPSPFRATLAMLLRSPRTLFAVVPWFFFAALTRQAGPTGATVPLVLLGRIAVPVVVFAAFRTHLADLDEQAQRWVPLGVPKRTAAGAQLAALAAATAAPLAMLGALLALRFHGADDPAPTGDALFAAGLLALEAVVYLALFGAAASFRKGKPAFALFIVDLFFGGLPLLQFFSPRAHAASLLGAANVLGLPARGSSVALVVLGLAAGTVLHRRFKR